jgi:hypothetical protein
MKSSLQVLFLALLLHLSLTVKSQNSYEIFIDSREDCVLWESSMDDFGNIILVGEIGPYETFD